MNRWQAIPKVELHCHLLGVISPAILRRIQQQGDTTLVQPEALDTLHPVSDLASFRRWVEMLKPYHSASPERMRPILAAQVEALTEQNVVYSEIMLSPAMFPRERGDFLAAFHKWREWTNAMENGKIQIEFILVIPRTLSPEALEHDTALFLDLKRNELIAGVALVGIECGDSIHRFGPSFERWRDAGLGIEVHAGEHTGPESVWDALEHAVPDRLGHAITAFQDPQLLARIRSAGIHIEFCPTSNVRTGALSRLNQHPIAKAKEQGLSFSINTDDPGAFNCSLTEEYQHVADVFGFTDGDFEQVFAQSLAARFATRLRYNAAAYAST